MGTVQRMNEVNNYPAFFFLHQLKSIFSAGRYHKGTTPIGVVPISPTAVE